ncbi:unnamed protein product [Dicrocoelium dendriticum]|nr:unnamed protein product [Dicrocoelium dendriticum]
MYNSCIKDWKRQETANFSRVTTKWFFLTQVVTWCHMWTVCAVENHNLRRASFIAIPYTVLIIYCIMIRFRYGSETKFTEMVHNLDFHDAYQRYSNNPADPLLPKPLNPAGFRVLLRNSNSFETRDVVIFIKTISENYSLRKQIRETWGNAKCYAKHGFTAQIVFVVGVSAPDVAQQSEKQQRLNSEHLLYHDIIQFDFVDAYRNNTYKLMSILKYATEACSKSRFVLIFDEDFLVSPKNVVQTLAKVTQTHYPYYIGGHIMEGAGPIRNWADKWFMTTIQYPYVDLPRYPTGGSVFMSMDVAKLLAFGLRLFYFM